MHIAISHDSVINCKLFPAQRQDCKSFEELCQQWPWDKIDYVVADKEYYTSNVRNIIKTHNAKPVIPPKGVYLPNDSTLTPEDFL